MKNPYFQGVELAQALKQFAQPTDEQQYDSINRGISQFGAALGSHPTGVKRGFLDNLASFAPAMSQGNVAYLDSQKAHETSNALSIKEALAREMEQRKLQMQENKEEKKSFWQQRQYELAERRLAQQQEFQNQNLLIKQQKQVDKERKEQEALETTRNIDGKDFYKITDKIELRDNEKQLANIKAAKTKFAAIEKDFNKLQKVTKDNLIPPIGAALSNTSAWTKDKLGRLGVKDFAKEIAERANLEAELGQFNVTLETALTKKAMTQGMYDRLKGFYPDIQNDSLPVIKKKMESIRRGIDVAHDTVDFAVKHKVLADPEDFMHHYEPQKQYNEQGAVKMKNPKTGTVKWVMPSSVPQAETNGAEYVYE